MPSWPSRFVPGPSNSNNLSPTSAASRHDEVPPRGQFLAAAAREDSSSNAASRRQRTFSGGSASSASPVQRPSGHGRSISHPFPSLFGNGKKAERKPAMVVEGSSGVIGIDLNSSDEEAPGITDGPGKNNIRTPGQRRAAQLSDTDLVTGRCATCDSMVRWPCHLDVYRCSTCLMINDLKLPAVVSGRVQAETPSCKTDSLSSVKIVPPLSLDRTKDLIDQCINSYLQRKARLIKGNEGIALEALSSVAILCAPATRSTNNTSAPPLYWHPSPHTGTNARPPPSPSADSDDPQISHAKYTFQPLEKYLVASLQDCACLNSSFSVKRPSLPVRSASEGTALKQNTLATIASSESATHLSEVDAKTLLLGDFAENGLWWTGAGIDRHRSQRDNPEYSILLDGTDTRPCHRSSRINWPELDRWYSIILSCGESWRENWRRLGPGSSDIEVSAESLSEIEKHIEEDMVEARLHVQKTILKAIENLLRRPGRPLRVPEDCRFLPILLANPLLSSPSSNASKLMSLGEEEKSTSNGLKATNELHTTPLRRSLTSTDQVEPKGPSAGRHSGIIKRILGLMANLTSDCHEFLLASIYRMPESHFGKTVELVGSFVNYRLCRLAGRKRSLSHDPTAGLIPDISGPGAGTSAHLHAALGTTTRSRTPEARENHINYGEDWQIRAAAKVMSLLFTVNNSGLYSRRGFSHDPLNYARGRAQRRAQHLPTSQFYNTLLDCTDLIADFEAWESKRSKFTFCQYPMFLSIWAKIRIMEYDARRQMEVKAREAFFDSIISRRAVSQYLVLKVRRECLVDDSLRKVSEVVGTGQEEIKKGLRIEFVGEEGVDAGGLRKEWFLLLVREVFDPDYGLFIYDEDSRYCYFNPSSFETSDQFFLVGVVLGLAIYNSTILDVALPPFAFRKLLSSAPNQTGPAKSSTRPSVSYTLEDLEEYRPVLAKGLRQLLEYKGDVEAVFCREFVIDVDRYGQIARVPLCSNGENRVVTSGNRREFVDLYVHYVLDTAVVRQYEPFKRGFFTVCGGNALSLFRPEEIELLVRGSDEALDVNSLRAVAVYENWGGEARVEQEPTIAWFWELFLAVDVKFQRRILSFITGSDRIPAMGATSLVIKVACLGDDHERFPTARTCFNMLGLYRYMTKGELETRLCRAVLESEGFGLR